MMFPLHLPLGCWCSRRSKPKDNLQAQEDQIHLQESTTHSDQQAAERVEKKQSVLFLVFADTNYVIYFFMKALKVISGFVHQTQTPTAPPPVPPRLSLLVTATCQTMAQTLSSARDPAAPLSSHSSI